jgi:hypothetical protein
VELEEIALGGDLPEEIEELVGGGPPARGTHRTPQQPERWVVPDVEGVSYHCPISIEEEKCMSQGVAQISPWLAEEDRWA